MSQNPNYRVYSLDEWRILHGEWLEAASDREAIAAARAAYPGFRCEVWGSDRLIAKFGPGSLSA